MQPSITESQVLAQLRAFLLNVLPAGVEVFKGQANLVPEPKGPDFVVMTPMRRRRLSTTVQTWERAENPTATVFTEPTELAIQLDIHGESSTDNGQTVTTLVRSSYACDFMAGSGVQPLYCEDGNQVPFINAEQQYEDRWVITPVFQISPAISTPQEFADTLTVGVIEVDSAYPPGA